MAVDHSHILIAIEFLKREWVWLSGVVIVLWYSLKWAVSKEYMERHEIMELFDAHEKREFARQDKFDAENRKAHGLLLDKIDDIKDIIIENLRSK